MESMDRLEMNLNIFKGKKVFVTGHNGFKGSWLVQWLNILGCKIKGYSLKPEKELCHYNLIDGDSKCHSIIGDILDRIKLEDEIENFQPDFIFHLAAQSLVRKSYSEPILTYETNVIGTGNVILACQKVAKACTVIIVTTDKVYENLEWEYPYRENDRLGGYDPYSSSKACAELISSSFINSFFNKENYTTHQKQFSVVRAGNVIGGGDWAENRIVPDIIRSINDDVEVVLRSPNSIRPWQHVLEPLFGYLLLASKMYNSPNTLNEAWNFGPENRQFITVEELTKMCIQNLGKGKYVNKSKAPSLHEAKLLKLDISKAKHNLGWMPKLSDEETVSFTTTWYKDYFDSPKTVSLVTISQINQFMEKWKEF